MLPGPLQAADDPIAPEHAIPYEALHDNPNCILAVTPAGGHLGWVSGHDAPLGELLVKVQLFVLMGCEREVRFSLSRMSELCIPTESRPDMILDSGDGHPVQLGHVALGIVIQGILELLKDLEQCAYKSTIHL